MHKKTGVPVLAKVAAILCPICPDLPIPITTTRPNGRHCLMSSMANENESPSLSFPQVNAFISISKTFFARLIDEFTRILTFNYFDL